MKELKTIFFILSLSLLLGYLALVCVKAIPNKFIEYNIKFSAQKMKEECDVYNNAYSNNKYYSYDSANLYIDGAFLDTFANADGYAICYNKKTNNPFYDSLYCWNYYIKNIKQNTRGVKALLKTLYNKIEDMGVYDHSQEWHGYQVFLKPALIFFNIKDIRLICLLFTQVLLLLVCLQIYEINKNYVLIIPFFIGFEYFNFSLESMSLLFCMDIDTMLLSCLAILYVLKNNKPHRYTGYIFILTGVFAAYFSMFTLPLITIGFPLILWLSLQKDETKEIILSIKHFVYWLIGYFVMGLGKIAISIIFSNSKNGIILIKWYSGIMDKISIADRFKDIWLYIANINNGSLVRLYLLIGIMIFLIVSIYINFFKLKKHIHFKTKYILYVFIGALPLMWVFCVPCHIKEYTIFLFSVSVYSVIQLLFDINNEVKK